MFFHLLPLPFVIMYDMCLTIVSHKYNIYFMYMLYTDHEDTTINFQVHYESDNNVVM